MTTTLEWEKEVESRWPRVIAWAGFKADDGCEGRVQIGGYPRESCPHGRPYRLAFIATDQGALDRPQGERRV